jgi:signal transduction histidine kinase
MEHAGAGRVAVEVGAGEAGGAAIIRVTDDGPRLDEVASKRAFDRMWRGDPARSGVGQGLGLPIARCLGRAMGATTRWRRADRRGLLGGHGARRGYSGVVTRSPGPGPKHYARAGGRRSGFRFAS